MDNYKLIINYHFEDVLLFDLSKDPYEKTDLAKTEPERTEKMKMTRWLLVTILLAVMNTTAYAQGSYTVEEFAEVRDFEIVEVVS